MAAAAVARIVIVWFFLTVATVAVWLAGMIKFYILPGGFLVAAAALSKIMIDG